MPANSAPPVGASATSSIYLADLYDGAVLIYANGASGNVSPSAIIAGSNTGFTDSTGSSPIFGFAVDPSAGTVYVLTQTANANGATVAESVLVFAMGSDGNVAPTATIELPTSLDAESLAFSGGSLYVTDDTGTGAVAVFPANATGATSPSRTFSPAGGFTNTANTVSVDASGIAYVSTYDQTATSTTEATQGVYVFPATSSGAVAAQTLAGSSTGFGSGVLVGTAIDSMDRIDAVVDDQTSDIVADVDEFAAGASGNTAPATAFQDTTSQGPIDIAVDASNNVYVAEIGSTTQYAQVDVFANGSTTPARTIEAYRAALPLIAIGPYVSPDASDATPVSRTHRFGTSLRRQSRLLRMPSAARFAR